MDDRDITEMYPPTIYKERRMKINDENIIPPRIKQIIESCEALREYYEEKGLHKPLVNADYYNAGKIHAYEDVLDMFEQLGIIEEESEDGPEA